MTDAPELKYSHHCIKATCQTGDLLAAIESFEQIGCAFGIVTNAYMRAKGKHPNLETFTVRGTEFDADGLWNRVLILSHVAKPSEGNPSVPTLRPFAELLVQHSITHARLINPNPYVAWVEVTADGRRWRKLRQTEAPPAQPSPTPVIEPAIPPAPDAQEAHAGP